MDDSLIFLDHEDFANITHDELNYSTMQIHKQDHFEFKARMFAYKWSIMNNKSREKLIPYSVKPDFGVPHNWKSYVILLMNSNDNVIKKICFPAELYQNFALVANFDENCTKKIEKFYKYKILEDESSKNNDEIDIGSKKKELTNKFEEAPAAEAAIPNTNIDKDKKIKKKQIKKKVKKNNDDEMSLNLRGLER